MIIGFLGKGGSGKTTVATLFAHYLVSKGKEVFAIDNDHNMDFAFNLGQEQQMQYMGQGLKDVFSHLGISSTLDTLVLDRDDYFSLSPRDAITEKYSIPIRPHIRLMVAGPHTEEIMIGKQCSHVLTTPLKAYLPFLSLKENEFAVIDEKAGADGVGTGITTGFHAACIVVEATPHGVKAALQISHMLRFYNTPYCYVVNKVRETTDLALIVSKLDKEPIVLFGFEDTMLDLKSTDSSDKKLELLFQWLMKVGDSRKERSKVRLQKLQALQ